jgi:hypothetical protein
MESDRDRFQLIYERLKILENLGKECYEDHKDWHIVVRKIPEFDVDKNLWITDQSLGDFFKRQGNLPVKKRLSASFVDRPQ